MSFGTYHYIYSGVDTQGKVISKNLYPYTGEKNAGAIFEVIGTKVKDDTIAFFEATGFTGNLSFIEDEISKATQQLLVPDDYENRFKEIVLSEKNPEKKIEDAHNKILDVYKRELNLQKESADLAKFQANLLKVKDGEKKLYFALNYYFGQSVEGLAVERAQITMSKFLKELKGINFDEKTFIQRTGAETGTSGRQVKGDYFIEFKRTSDGASFKFGVSVKGSRASGGRWVIGSQSFDSIANFLDTKPHPEDLNKELFGNEKLIKKSRDGKYTKDSKLWKPRDSRRFFTALVFDIVSFGYSNNRPLLRESWQSDQDGNPTIKIDFLYKMFEKLATNPTGLSVEGSLDGLAFKASISKSVVVVGKEGA